MAVICLQPQAMAGPKTQVPQHNMLGITFTQGFFYYYYFYLFIYIFCSSLCSPIIFRMENISY